MKNTNKLITHLTIILFSVLILLFLSSSTIHAEELSVEYSEDMNELKEIDIMIKKRIAYPAVDVDEFVKNYDQELFELWFGEFNVQKLGAAG